jgi:ABC-2 type transport system ATP-binding protein
VIELSNLTKKYGDTVALDHVTLSVNPGEIIGLLGPNGAGKTTMLKMLTGYLPPTEGTARVANLDILESSLEVRRRIGYLPETNPLYEDLAVYESLQWTGRLRGMTPSSLPAAMSHVIDVCGLSSVVGKDISQLSKGYRQRVGLAQAILHDPEILILDEPTSGLDPNQQQEVRQLIQTLKQKKTVILSTHILPEAQTSCDRVLIIHRGRIVADGTPQSLSQKATTGSRLKLELKAPASSAEQAVAQLTGVDRVSVLNTTANGVLLTVESTGDLREALFDLAVQNRWPILGMTQETLSLEEVFRQLTTGN